MSSAASLVREYIETVWNQGHTNDIGRYVADDLKQHSAGLPDGRAPLASFIDDLRAQVPEARFDIRRVIASPDGFLAVHSLFLPAPGAPGMAVVDIFQVRDGVIVEHWDVKEDIPESTVSGRETV